MTIFTYIHAHSLTCFVQDLNGSLLIPKCVKVLELPLYLVVFFTATTTSSSVDRVGIAEPDMFSKFAILDQFVPCAISASGTKYMKRESFKETARKDNFALDQSGRRRHPALPCCFDPLGPQTAMGSGIKLAGRPTDCGYASIGNELLHLLSIEFLNHFSKKILRSRRKAINRGGYR